MTTATTTNPGVRDRDRDRDACDALIRAHLRLMFAALHRLRRTAAAVALLDPDDALSAAYLGTWAAARRWDAARGAFATLCYRCVRQCLFRAARLRHAPAHVSLDALHREFAGPMLREDRHQEYTADDVL